MKALYTLGSACLLMVCALPSTHAVGLSNPQLLVNTSGVTDTTKLHQAQEAALRASALTLANFAENAHRGFPLFMYETNEQGEPAFEPFFDYGSLQGYLLPDNEAPIGGFPGPALRVDMQYAFLSPNFDLLKVYADGKEVKLKSNKLCTLPGELHQHLVPVDSNLKLTVNLRLSFVTPRTALTQTTILNPDGHELKLVWQGTLMQNGEGTIDENALASAQVSDKDPASNYPSVQDLYPGLKRIILPNERNGVTLRLSKAEGPYGFALSGSSQYEIARSIKNITTTVDNTDKPNMPGSYTQSTTTSEPEVVIYTAASYFSSAEDKAVNDKVPELLAHAADYMEQSRVRWEMLLLNDAFSPDSALLDEYSSRNGVLYDLTKNGQDKSNIVFSNLSDEEALFLYFASLTPYERALFEKNNAHLTPKEMHDLHNQIASNVKALSESQLMALSNKARSIQTHYIDLNRAQATAAANAAGTNVTSATTTAAPEQQIIIVKAQNPATLSAVPQPPVPQQQPATQPAEQAQPGPADNAAAPAPTPAVIQAAKLTPAMSTKAPETAPAQAQPQAQAPASAAPTAHVAVDDVKPVDLRDIRAALAPAIARAAAAKAAAAKGETPAAPAAQVPATPVAPAPAPKAPADKAPAAETSAAPAVNAPEDQAPADKAAPAASTANDEAAATETKSDVAPVVSDNVECAPAESVAAEDAYAPAANTADTKDTTKDETVVPVTAPTEDMAATNKAAEPASDAKTADAAETPEAATADNSMPMCMSDSANEPTDLSADAAPLDHDLATKDEAQTKDAIAPEATDAALAKSTDKSADLNTAEVNEAVTDSLELSAVNKENEQNALGNAVEQYVFSHAPIAGTQDENASASSVMCVPECDDGTTNNTLAPDDVATDEELADIFVHPSPYDAPVKEKAQVKLELSDGEILAAYIANLNDAQREILASKMAELNAHDRQILRDDLLALAKAKIKEGPAKSEEVKTNPVDAAKLSDEVLMHYLNTLNKSQRQVLLVEIAKLNDAERQELKKQLISLGEAIGGLEAVQEQHAIEEAAKNIQLNDNKSAQNGIRADVDVKSLSDDELLQYYLQTLNDNQRQMLFTETNKLGADDRLTLKRELLKLARTHFGIAKTTIVPSKEPLLNKQETDELLTKYIATLNDNQRAVLQALIAKLRGEKLQALKDNLVDSALMMFPEFAVPKVISAPAITINPQITATLSDIERTALLTKYIESLNENQRHILQVEIGKLKPEDVKALKDALVAKAAAKFQVTTYIPPVSNNEDFVNYVYGLSPQEIKKLQEQISTLSPQERVALKAKLNALAAGLK